MLVLVGSLTRGAPHFASVRGEGISVFSFDPVTGVMDRLHLRDGIDSPCFLAVHPSRPWVYAVSEVFGWNEGTVSAYRLDHETGVLSYVNKQPTQGSLSCFCGLDGSGRHVAVANYTLGGLDDEPRRAFAVLPLREDGGLQPASATIRLHGTGPDPKRQEQPHGHWVGFSPDDRFLVGVDLGTDRVLSYPFDTATGEVREGDVSVCALPGGAGPRHLTFAPDGRSAYVSLEMADAVARLGFDPSRGRFTFEDSKRVLPEGEPAHAAVSDLALVPGGRMLVVASRGHDGLTVFRRDRSGRLAPSQHVVGHGVTPRHLQVDPTGRWLLVAYQDSDAVGVYAIDDDACRLALARHVPCGSPMCVRIISAIS